MVEKTGNWVQYDDFETAGDLKMTPEEYKEWQAYKQIDKSNGLDVSFDLNGVEVSKEDITMSKLSTLSFTQKDNIIINEYLTTPNGELVYRLLDDGVYLKDNVDYGGTRIDQYALNLTGKEGACVYSSIVTGAYILSGDTSKNPEKIYWDSNSEGYIGKGNSPMWINDYEGIAGKAGVNADISSNNLINDNYSATKDFVNNLNKEKLILTNFDWINNKGKVENHTELIKGYEVDNSGSLKFNVLDPGKFKASNVNPIDMKPYKIVNNKEKEDDKTANSYRTFGLE